MATRRLETRSRSRAGHSAVVVVRLVAFVAATLGILGIPAILVATATGHLPNRTAVAAISIALLVVAVAALAVRPFDPLRR